MNIASDLYMHAYTCIIIFEGCFKKKTVQRTLLELLYMSGNYCITCPHVCIDLNGFCNCEGVV